MIIAIEGIEGCGKTTAALAISERTGWPVHKPLHLAKDTPGRWTPDERARWRKGDVPVQTHAEDLYIIDVLAAQVKSGQKPGFIMDRSVFSGLAYRQDRYAENPDLTWIFDRWVKLALIAGVHVVHLDQPPHVSLDRMELTDARSDWGWLNHHRGQIQRWMDRWSTSGGWSVRLDSDRPSEFVIADVIKVLGL